MIAVIFEAWPAHAREAEYLDLAAALRPDRGAYRSVRSAR
jgi:hypothetical protein